MLHYLLDVVKDVTSDLIKDIIEVFAIAAFAYAKHWINRHRHK